MERKRSVRGKLVAFDGLPEKDFILESFASNVVSIATDGKTTIMLFEEGGWAFTAGLPTALRNELDARKTLPAYVALGSQNRWFLTFANGAETWNGPDEMSRVLQDSALVEQHRGVRTVAFGSTFDSYFIVFNDGWWCRGDLPDGLKIAIQRLGAEPSFKCVSLGPDGEWYLETLDGKAGWGGVPNHFDHFIRRVKKDIKFIDFGKDKSYLIRYS